MILEEGMAELAGSIRYNKIVRENKQTRFALSQTQLFLSFSATTNHYIQVFFLFSFFLSSFSKYEQEWECTWLIGTESSSIKLKLRKRLEWEQSGAGAGGTR